MSGRWGFVFMGQMNVMFKIKSQESTDVIFMVF